MSFEKFLVKEAPKSVKHLNAWSYSSLTALETCPKKFEYEKIEKRYTPPSAALENGIAVHSACEKFIRGQVDTLPEKFCDKTIAALIELREADAISEAEWGFRRDFKPCGFFDHEVWLRCKIDAHFVQPDGSVRVVDFKTGKHGHAADYEDQVNLYAMAAMLAYPHAQSVACELWFVEDGFSRIQFPVVHRDELPELCARWGARSEKMFDCTSYPPSTGWQCGGCYFNGNNGGPCGFGTVKPMWKNYYEKHGEKYDATKTRA